MWRQSNSKKLGRRYSGEVIDGFHQLSESKHGGEPSVSKVPNSSSIEAAEALPSLEDAISKVPSRKRKRKIDLDDVEGNYMHKLVKEETKHLEKEKERQRRKITNNNTENETDGEMDPIPTPPELKHRSKSLEETQGVSNNDIPKHETLASLDGVTNLERASRTIFLGNVSTLSIKSKTAKKTLLDHISAFLPSLPQNGSVHKVESLRFRSTAFNSGAGPKRAAYATKQLMDATTTSTNAYAVYTTEIAAREAVKRLNGSVVLHRHLRVDGVAHPAEIDPRRCVFVGNLGFVDNESVSPAADGNKSDEKPRRSKVPADTEEGLWIQFGKVGKVESVRVVRDKSTRVGKGFAYVQFQASLPIVLRMRLT